MSIQLVFVQEVLLDTLGWLGTCVVIFKKILYASNFIAWCKYFNNNTVILHLCHLGMWVEL